MTETTETIRTMKIFQTFQNLVCFSFPNSNWIRKSHPTNADTLNLNDNYPFNVINFLPWLHVVFCFILAFIYIFFGATIFQEYSDCTYGVLATALATFNGFTIFLNRGKYFDFINHIEKVVEQRKKSFLIIIIVIGVKCLSMTQCLQVWQNLIRQILTLKQINSSKSGQLFFDMCSLEEHQ